MCIFSWAIICLKVARSAFVKPALSKALSSYVVTRVSYRLISRYSRDKALSRNSSYTFRSSMSAGFLEHVQRRLEKEVWLTIVERRHRQHHMLEHTRRTEDQRTDSIRNGVPQLTGSSIGVDVLARHHGRSCHCGACGHSERCDCSDALHCAF